MTSYILAVLLDVTHVRSQCISQLALNVDTVNLNSLELPSMFVSMTVPQVSLRILATRFVQDQRHLLLIST